MPVYTHITHALQIMADEPNWRLWGPHIDKLPEPEQTECRLWLRQEALKRNYHEAALKSAKYAPTRFAPNHKVKS